MPQPSPAFTLLNPDATGPVVLSVPHAGRDYSREHRALTRPPVEKLIPLEDRLADRLVEQMADVPVLVARAPRSWIDLNRHEAEIDPGLVDGFVASRLMITPKVRSGLGLIPRRLAGVGEIWRGRLRHADVCRRIAEVHRPYHQALKALLDRARALHGVAVLIDLHSMPPLGDISGRSTAGIVIGNRFGHTASAWATGCAAMVCARHGLGWRENTPYAGGYIVERHGAPTRSVHALQLEVDRSLYLDGDECSGPGLLKAQAFLSELVAELTVAALGTSLPQAAE
jgi:N-formylglutamate amidohydrolase